MLLLAVRAAWGPSLRPSQRPGLTGQGLVAPWLCAAGRCLGGGWSAYSSHLGKSISQGPAGPAPTVSPLAASLCSGWIAALSTLKEDHLAVSIIMMVVAGFFTLCTVLSLFLLKRVSVGAGPTATRGRWHLSPAFASSSSLEQLGSPGPKGPAGVIKALDGRSAGPQGGLLMPASFLRCTPCTAGRGPASSRPRRSFPRASSATGPSAALPPVLPEEPSRGTRLPTVLPLPQPFLLPAF